MPSTTHTQSCLDISSAFYQVLVAPYRPLTRVRAPPPIPVTPQEAERCRSIVDWPTEPSSPPEPDSSDEEDSTPVTSSANSPDMERLIYKPSGKWGWASGLAIEDTEILMRLGSGLMCSATIKQGTLAGRSVTYISKIWSKQTQKFWRGFHSELALYKSSQYLRPLQGTVVPPIIGVYALPGEIGIAMEPPHHSFWIEASCDMPNVLKERCISAFEKLHSAGVLHGDVELRHMLIGGDAKVTIIDFQASRALVPNDDVMLQIAKPEELRMEMRKVKYKLDYEGARDNERKKVSRCHQRSQKNRIRRKKLQQRARGDRPGYISDIEEDPEEDKAEPPVHKQDWNEHWIVAHPEPRRFVMPNQTPQNLEREIQHFLAIVEHMGLETKAVVPQDPRLPSTPPPSPITALLPVVGQVHTVSEDSPNHRYWLRKRKGSTTSPARPGKRFCSRKDTTSLVPSSTVSDSIIATAEEPLASGDRFPLVKSRDFAYESYNGPRGYYVPHPPTEDRAARERQWYIHVLNAQRCWVNGLPHPAVLSLQGGQGLLRTAQNVRGKRLMVQMGSLKRAREDSENPGAVREWAAQKKARYELAKHSDVSTRKRKRDGRDELLEGYTTSESDEPSELPEGPRILTQAEYLARPTSTQTHGAASSSTPLSILRKTLPVHVVSHREHRDGSGLTGGSSKLGPGDLRVPPLRKRKLEAHDGSSRASRRVFQSNEHLNGSDDIMALATLGLLSAGLQLSTGDGVTGHGITDSRSESDSVAISHAVPQEPQRGGKASPGLNPLAHSSALATSTDEAEEVENLLRPWPWRTDASDVPTSSSSSLSAWMETLLRWIR